MTHLLYPAVRSMVQLLLIRGHKCLYMKKAIEKRHVYIYTYCQFQQRFYTISTLVQKFTMKYIHWDISLGFFKTILFKRNNIFVYA